MSLRNLKNSTNGPKRKNRPRLKMKGQGDTFKPKIDILYQQVPKKFLNLTLIPKIAPKGPKRAKKAPYGTESKRKIGISFQN